MSTNAHAATHSGSAAHSHGSHGPEEHGGQHASTMRGYMTGFVLSVILTAIPFWLVMSGVLGSNVATALTVMAFAAVQIVVHMIYFLHMDGRSEGGWTLMALIFTLVLVVITLTGSLWVMYHLNTNMMPAMQDMERMEVNGPTTPAPAGGKHPLPGDAGGDVHMDHVGSRPIADHGVAAEPHDGGSVVDSLDPSKNGVAAPAPSGGMMHMDHDGSMK